MGRELSEDVGGQKLVRIDENVESVTMVKSAASLYRGSESHIMRIQNIHVLSFKLAIFPCHQRATICLSNDPIVKAFPAVLFSKRR